MSLGVALVRSHSVDLGSADDSIAVEVKRVTIQNVLQLQAATSVHGGLYPSDRLNRHWTLLVHSAEGRPPAKIRGLADKAVPLLARLEQAEITAEREGETVPPAAHLRGDTKAAMELDRLLSGGTATSVPTSEDLPAGVEIKPSWGIVAPTSPDRFSAHIEEWLLGGYANKLRAQLGASGAAERHAFLYPDSHTPFDWFMKSNAWGVPTRRLELPSEIDALWIGNSGNRIVTYRDGHWSQG